MKRKIINYALLLFLLGASTIGVVWAGAIDKTNGIPPEFKPFAANGQKDTANLTSCLGFKSPGRWFPGRVVNLDLRAYDLQDIRKFRMDVKYNPEQLRLVHVSRGAFLVEDQGLADWNSGVIDAQQGLVTNISGIRRQPFSGGETTLIRLDFIVIGAGKGRISLENTKMVSSNGIERAFNFAPLEYEIVREK